MTMDLGRDDFFASIEEKKDVIKEKNKVVKLDENEKQDIFKVTINDDDDLLVKIVKGEINNRKVNLKTLPFTTNMERHNFKSALLKRNSMTMDKFERWMELLGKEFEVVLTDKEQ